MTLDVARIRKDFPILDRQVRDGQPLVYLDSANTSQKPRQVIERLDEFYERHNANIHRASHQLGEEATAAYEGARIKAAGFIGARDETDSGLDIDALRVVSEGVNRFSAQPGHGVLLITHYTRILRYVKPDFVHVFVGGRIVDEGGPELAETLESEGYEKWIKAAAGVPA